MKDPDADISDETKINMVSRNTGIANWARDSLPYFLGVLFSILIAFYIRIIPRDSVFIGEFVRFGGNDPWYYIRLVETMVANYPQFLWFEAYTYYPFGMEQTWAPGYAMILVTAIMIIGMGNPSPELVYTASAYYPAVMGALVAIPTYYAAKWVFSDRRIGLFAAFLIGIAPGQFLSRSTIGFNDHHVAEVLFSTMVAMFMIMALIKSREHGVTLEKIKKFDLASIRTPFVYFGLAGFMLGVYTISWKGALFFSFMLGLYITIQHIIDHMHNRETAYMAAGGMIVFAVNLVIVLVTPEIGTEKSRYIMALIAGIVAFPLMTALSIGFERFDLKRYYYPLTLTGLFAAVVIISRMFVPAAYDLITNLSTYFVRTGGGLTIAEASPLLVRGGEITLLPLWYNFGAGAIVSFIVLIYLGYTAITQKNTQEKTFLIVWSFIVIWAMLQQNRFTYYYAVNVAILCSFAGIMILDKAGWPQLINNLRNRKISSSSKDDHKKDKKKDGKAKVKKPDTSNQKPGIWHIVSVALVVLVLIYPAGSMALDQASRGTGGPNGAWIETMHWLKYNTPDNGVDYLEIYDFPPAGEPYPYPEEAYGVMSWWDYGHWIMAIGERIPHSNPFQRGARTAGEFFTAPSEQAATEKLYDIHPDPDKAAARYIISDVEMATGKFYAMAAWTLDTDGYYVQAQTDTGFMTVPGQRYFDSMEARLHIFDGNGLKQYRMVYESPAGNTQEPGYKNVYNVLFEGNLPETNTGYVKIFEYVKGASITGTAPEGETVTISNNIMTNQMRTFTYTQSATSDGTYTFIVPYSTEGPIEGETQFATMPTGPYVISYGDVSEEVSVTEIDVLHGNTIEV